MNYSFNILILLFSFLLLGCGNEGTTESSVDSSLIIETQKSEINELKSKMNIDFLVKNDYGSEVAVALSNLNMEVAPCRVQSVVFEPKKVLLDDEKSE